MFVVAQSQWTQVAKIRGREAQAIAVAVREFEKHKGSKTEKGEPVYGDLIHYDVYLAKRGEVVEVGFSPDLGPVDRKEGTVGGRYAIRVRDIL